METLRRDTCRVPLAVMDAHVCETSIRWGPAIPEMAWNTFTSFRLNHYNTVATQKPDWVDDGCDCETTPDLRVQEGSHYRQTRGWLYPGSSCREIDVRSAAWKYTHRCCMMDARDSILCRALHFTAVYLPSVTHIKSGIMLNFRTWPRHKQSVIQNTNRNKQCASHHVGDMHFQ